MPLPFPMTPGGRGVGRLSSFQAVPAAGGMPGCKDKCQSEQAQRASGPLLAGWRAGLAASAASPRQGAGSRPTPLVPGAILARRSRALASPECPRSGHAFALRPGARAGPAWGTGASRLRRGTCAAFSFAIGMRTRQGRDPQGLGVRGGTSAARAAGIALIASMKPSPSHRRSRKSSGSGTPHASHSRPWRISRSSSGNIRL